MISAEMIYEEELRSTIQGEVLFNESLARYSSFRIGGNADVFIKPKDKSDALRAVEFFHYRQIPYIVLGRGSNVLISDEGVRGAVISLRDNLEKVEVTAESETEAHVYVEAGVDLPALASKLLKQGFGGLENLSGVPGSVGGAILMNAGAYGKEIFEVIVWVEVIRDGKILRLNKSEINVQYRSTDLGNDIILACELKLNKLTNEEAELANSNRKIWMEKRRKSQPLTFPNAGSIFKNPPPEADGTARYAGALIEACGLKGMRTGGAKISEIHANFIINAGDADASDVMALIELAKASVKKKFDVDLELEIKLIGFENEKV